MAPDDSTMPPIPGTPTPDLCPACGEPTEDGTCWNLWCPEGFDNIQQEIGDDQYHAAVDQATVDAAVEVDL